MNAREQIQKWLQEKPVLLFMKGTPNQPQCGFSARVVQILDFLKANYDSFDVLSDSNIREGIKEYGNWPTIPQLYVDQELLGGCDIIQEQFQNGQLEKSLENYINS